MRFKNFIIKTSKSIKPWGFYGMSLFDVANFFIKGLVYGSITTRASSLAFNFFLAFFPAIIVLFTIIPYIPIEGFQLTLIELIDTVFPASTSEATKIAIEEIIKKRNSGLLSLGFLLALYFSTNGINSLISAFNASFHVNETRSLLQQFFLSLILTIILSFVLIITIILIIFGKYIINYLILEGFIEQNITNVILIAKWGLIIVMLFTSISIIFHLGPAMKKRWKIVSAGSIISTCLIITTSLLFSYFINNFNQYNKIYGSIGTLMIILIWIYFNCIGLLLGFELNASISNAKKKSKE